MRHELVILKTLSQHSQFCLFLPRIINQQTVHAQTVPKPCPTSLDAKLNCFLQWYAPKSLKSTLSDHQIESLFEINSHGLNHCYTIAIPCTHFLITYGKSYVEINKAVSVIDDGSIFFFSFSLLLGLILPMILHRWWIVQYDFRCHQIQLQSLRSTKKIAINGFTIDFILTFL